MQSRNLDKGLEIISKLITGEEIGKNGANVTLYEEYNSNMEVYDFVQAFLKKMNLKVYEYNYALFACAGENNKVFGYTNEELKRIIGLRLNKELYLCYYIIYNIITVFLSQSGDFVLSEYVRAQDIISAVDMTIPRIINKEYGIVISDCEENSLKTIAVLWDELPMVSQEDADGTRASRGSKTGYVKLVFNFLIGQGLFVQNDDRYYAKDRFIALAKNYYDEHRGRLHSILSRKEDDVNATD